MRLVQLRIDGKRVVAASQGGDARIVTGTDSVRALALAAIEAGRSLAEEVAARSLGRSVDLAAALAAGDVLAPIDHDDPAHLVLTGTGLTHLGSADARDKMHQAAASGTETDSIRMFRMGLEGGKPEGDAPGVQPEWFYKGDGTGLIGPGRPLTSPSFALDGGEEPEIAGIYLIGHDGRVHRIGFALGNEFSDHVTEQQNYLYLAHSKLRQAAIGPELLVGALPQDIRGTSSLVRGGETIWSAPFLSGEANMSHSIANLEYHHFKYAQFRRPGDVHIHFFGTATLSFAAGMRAAPGDVFRIEVPEFGLPLENKLAIADETQHRVHAL
ncbi:AraD1 family protein [Sphingomonas sp. dw_22]|uniref:AraD1 family protein n=1 Tax=Sphingomonas sp. dw_22 TaxID=2721175 RepID=UPI001BD58F85